MHENELSAEHFDRVAGLMKARGYRFVRLEEALADEAYRHATNTSGAARAGSCAGPPRKGSPTCRIRPSRPAWLETMEADRSPYDPPDPHRAGLQSSYPFMPLPVRHDDRR